MDAKLFLQYIVDLFPDRQLNINMSFDGHVNKLNEIWKERSFTALITQTVANAPVVNVLRNDFTTRTVTRIASGVYRISVADIIKIGKIAPIKELITDAEGNTISMELIDNEYYEILTKDSDGNAADSILTNQFVEFSIY